MSKVMGTTYARGRLTRLTVGATVGQRFARRHRPRRIASVSGGDDREGTGVDRPAWATDDIDLDRPSIARVYDFFLGGSHHFAVDRAMAEQLLKLAPDVGEIMQANRAFLRRAVRFMVGAGITQFLDIGSGIPTVGNVHEVAQ